MKKINTVLGEITPEEINHVLCHEHVVCISHAMKAGFGDRWFNTEEVIDYAVKLFGQAKNECGINTIIDGTPLNLGRDISLLKEVSQKSGVNIIASSGLYYTEDYFLRGKTPEFLAEFFIYECINGINNTGVKPGFLKCATNDAGVTDLNRITLETMAIVQRETKLPMFAHNYHAKKTAYDQLEIFGNYGVDLSKIVIGHSSSTADIAYLEELLKQGCYLGFDRIGYRCLDQAKVIVELIRRGWEDKILLSHDYSIYIDSKNHKWSTYKENLLTSERNFTNVSKCLLPTLEELGISKTQINKLMHDNPIAILTKD